MGNGAEAALKPGRSSWFVYGMLVVLFVVWSNSFHAIAYLRQQMQVSAGDLVTLRFGPVAPFCLLYCLWRWGESRELIKRHWARLLIVGALAVPGYNLALNWGQARVPAGTASLLIATNPVFVYLLAVAFLDERIRRTKVLGLALAFGGVWGLVQFQHGQFGGTYVRYALVILLAPLAWALATVAGKPVMGRRDPLLFTMAATGMGSLPYLAVLATGGGATHEALGSLSQTGWIALVYLSLGCTVFGYLVWFWALRHLSASSVAAFVFLNPPLTMLFGIIWGTEAFHWSLLVFGLVVLAGVALSAGVVRIPRR